MSSPRPLAMLCRLLILHARRVLQMGALRAAPAATPAFGPVALLATAVLLTPLPLAVNALATPAQSASTIRTPSGAPSGVPSGIPLTSGQLARLTNEAGSGNARAQLLLGMLYSDGTDPLVPKDMTRAAHWLQLATQGRDPLAHHLLGLQYFFGQGVPQDRDKARQHMDAALAGGYVASAHFMADMLLSLIMQSYDPAEAAR